MVIKFIMIIMLTTKIKTDTYIAEKKCHRHILIKLIRNYGYPKTTSENNKTLLAIFSACLQVIINTSLVVKPN